MSPLFVGNRTPIHRLMPLREKFPVAIANRSAPAFGRLVKEISLADGNRLQPGMFAAFLKGFLALWLAVLGFHITGARLSV